MLLKFTTVAFILLLFAVESEAMEDCREAAARTHAIQEIEYLRRWYAKATDKIGEASKASVKEGRKIYRRIFDAKARIRAGGDYGDKTGPDEWVDVVLGALGELGPTQHLIGTQLVELESLELDESGDVIAGEAVMESYVQAWHEMKDEKVWLFLGTYSDKVHFTPGKGWQIYDMSLDQVAGELRYMGAAVARSKD